MLAATYQRIKGDCFMRQKTDTARRVGLATPEALRPMGRGAVLNSVAAAVAGILYCAGSAYAADEQAAAPTTSSLDEIVVTASAQGVKKLDASYNIVSLSLDEIKNSNPASARRICRSWIQARCCVSTTLSSVSKSYRADQAQFSAPVRRAPRRTSS
jgi:hypothetical protein